MRRGPAGRDDRRHPGVSDPWSGGVEIEDLPAQRVLPTGRARLGLGGVLAIGTAAVFLAAGFGVLGGRPEATAPATAVKPTSKPSEAPAATWVPFVTPASPCGPSPQTPPQVLLFVNGRPTPGAIELLDWKPDSALASASVEGIPIVDPPERVEIRSDVATELRIADEICALAWTIELVASDGNDVLATLEGVSNLDRIPAFASQNRWPLPLADFPGTTLDLRATLAYPEFTAKATWPIRILRFTPPAGVLSAGRAPVATAAGCDVELMLGNGWTTQAQNPCAGDIAQDLGAPAVVEPGQQLTFKFDHDDWQIDDAVIACGQLSGTNFVPGPQCVIGEPDREQFSFTFAAPLQPGVFALALFTCGTQVLADATNRLCGTWYANVEVRGEPAP
jgi:hypothetical protein